MDSVERREYLVAEIAKDEIKLKPEAPRVGCLPNFKNIFKQNGDKPNESI